MPKLYLAPLQGLTDCYYRNLFALYFGGIDAAFSPFIADVSTIRVNSTKLQDLKPELNKHVSTIPQFLSKVPDEIILLAHAIHDLGYNEINWNIGCPFPKVANKKRGSGILPYPGLIAEIMEKIMPYIPVRLSVKMRLGYFSIEEIDPILQIFNNYNISEIIIHTRTGKQMYKGETYPEKFRECLQKTNIPLVYNGDIFSLKDFQVLSMQFPKNNTWMLGRGVLRDPFLALKIKNDNIPSVEERKHIILKFHNALYFQYQHLEKAKNFALSRMKGIWVYMQHSFVEPEKKSKQIFKAKNEADFFSAVESLFQHDIIE